MSAWLIDTLLYTGALIGLVLVLRRPVGRFFGPQLAYALWALPFLRLLLPPIVLPASFGPQPGLAAQAEPAEALSAEPMTLIDLPAELATPAAPIAAAESSPAPLWDSSDVVMVAASLWAGIALAFLAWRAVTYRQMRRELLERARPVGEIGKVRLVETPALAAPVAFGVLDKVIALPPLFMAQPDMAARDLAIEHELAHHNGHDLLANMAAQALLALHWFNPLAWYGWRAMRRDQEAACDARVLAGRGREERLRYAALIAGVATGPRLIAFKGALAAPMACPVLGERSIVHRLRSLSMSEMSRRRRWAGRAMIGVSALALPLTASISYASASAQLAPPAPPAPPAPLSAELPPAPPAAPAAPELDSGEPRVQTLVLSRAGPDGEPIVREFAVPRPPHPPHPLQAPHAPQPPQFSWNGHFDSEEFEREMEAFQREMENFREEWAENQDWEQYAREWEKWGEQFGEQWAEQHGSQALALAEQARRSAPEVIVDCNSADRPARTRRTADGRQQIVICDKVVNQFARASLRNARASIANNPEISTEVRTEILRDLDREIERIERE